MPNIFHVNDTTPSGVSRSVQPALTRRYICDMPYGLIVPYFKQYLYPGESIEITPTSFIRLPAPLNRPQLSRVRFVTRFYAVDLRTMWLPFEDYISGKLGDDSSVVEPYVVNCHYTLDPSESPSITQYVGSSAVINYDITAKTPDISPTRAQGQTAVNKGRKFIFTGYAAAADATYPSAAIDSKHGLYVCGVHELGDYLDTQLHTTYSYSPAENHEMLYRSAFDFCAYQLIFSYGLRNARVQKRIDDFYELAHSSGTLHKSLTRVFSTTLTGDITYKYRSPTDSTLVEASNTLTNTAVTYYPLTSPTAQAQIAASPYFEHDRDMSLSTDEHDVLATSWDNVEKFPLHNGANSCMNALDFDDNSGSLFYNTTSIALFRERYANWTSDRFIQATYTQQEGSEALIPVSGVTEEGFVTIPSVALTGLTVTMPQQMVRPAVYNSATNGFDVVGTRVYEEAPFTHDGYVEGLGNKQHGTSGFATTTWDAEGTHSYVYHAVEGGTFPIAGSGSVGGQAQIPARAISAYMTPSDFRFYMQLQHIKEMQQQIDGRYKSFMAKFFGSHVHDSRLDRPLYLGGYVQDLNVSEVQQTSESGTTPLGTSAGTIADGKRGYKIRFHSSEHSIVMGICFIMPDTIYTRGQDREFVTHDRYDWMLPQFANISNQPIYDYELAYAPFTSAASGLTPYHVYGYEPRYNQLRWKDDRAVGAFRDYFNATGNAAEYAAWVVQRDFGDNLSVKVTPSVSGTTVNLTVAPRLSPVVPVLSDKMLSMRYGVDDANFSVDPDLLYPFILDAYFDVRMVRKIPSTGIPRV